MQSLEDVALKYLNSLNHKHSLAEEVRAVYGSIKGTRLVEGESLTVSALKQNFKKLYEALKVERFVTFIRTVEIHEPSCLADEIVQYNKLAKEAGWKDEETFAKDTLKKVLLEQIQTICVKASKPSPKYTSSSHKAWETEFETLSPVNWTRLLRSILLLCNDFGHEIVWMEQLIDYKISRELQLHVVEVVKKSRGLRTVTRSDLISRNCLELQNTELGSQAGDGCVQAPLIIPESSHDPNHFGHLAWRYCVFIEGVST